MLRLPSSLLAGLLVLGASPVSAAVLFFDFGASANQAVAPYNNIHPGQLSLTDTVDSTGATTGIGITAAGFNSSNDDGPSSPKTPGPYPAVTGAAAIFSGPATGDSLFGNTSDFSGVQRPIATITLTGLNATMVYTFDFLAARLNVGDNRETQYSVAGLTTTSVFLNAANNTTNIATVSGMAPTAGGAITITMNAGPNNTNGTTKFYYINAMRVTSVPEPAAALLTVFGAALAFRRRRLVR